MATKKVIRPGRELLKRLVLSFVVAAAFILVHAARAELQFDVFLGYDDMVPERGWFPITCELHNDGPAFNAVIEVSSDQLGEGQSRRVPVDLPTNTRKRIVIPVFAASRFHAWNVYLLDDRGKVRAKQTALRTRRNIPTGLPMVAALSRTVGGVPIFPETKVKNQDAQPVAARLQSALFPDNPLALEGIDVLYLNSEKALDLSLTQATALLAWLQHGGHLVLGVEQISDVNGNPWLRDLMPCSFNATGSAMAHDQLQDWVRAPNQPPPTSLPSAANAKKRLRHRKKNGAEETNSIPDEALSDDIQFETASLPIVTGTLRDGKILVGDASAPLIIQAERGRGKITVLAFSPEREPFLSWKNRDWFWAKLAGFPVSAFEASDYTYNSARLSSDGVFGAMIDSKQVRKLPLGWLLALLVAYLAVIGPLDQYWLKKINRQMLTWITFPIYVVVFSGLIYLIGFHLRAGELEWNELSIVDVLPDGDRAVLRGQTYLSIYSPVNAHYNIASDLPFATLRGEFLGDFGANQESSHATVTQHGHAFDADTFVPVWTSQLYVSDWLQSTAEPLALTVEPTNGGWKITVENKTENALDQAKVVLRGRVYNLSSLPAGQSKTITVQTSDGTTLSQFASQYGQNFRSAVEARHNSFGNNVNEIPDIAAGSMAASFLSQVNLTGNNWDNFAVPPGLDLTRFADNAHAVFLAWDAGHGPTAPLNRFAAKRAHRNTLLRLVVPIANPS